MDEIVVEFLTEATELLDALERNLIDADGESGADLGPVVAETFRVFHTLKGTAGFLGFDRLRVLAHAAEDLLAAIRALEVRWTNDVTDVLLGVLDALRKMVAEGRLSGTDGTEGYPELIKRLRTFTDPRCDGCANEQAGAACAFPGCKTTPPRPETSGAAPVILGGTTGLAAAPAPAQLTTQPPSAPPAQPVAAPVQTPPEPLFKPRAPPPQRVAPAKPGSLIPPPAAAPPAPVAPVPPPAAAAAPGAQAPSAAATEHDTSVPGSLAAPAAAGGREASTDAGSLRVPVAVLDQLMNLVGELVLARNQLLCQEATRDDAGLTSASQRIHLLTTGLQDVVMRARMQPIGSVFSRLPRVARDAAKACGKSARLVTAGNETELDKALLEAVKDPLTHVVRNAIDHGLESPEGRAAAGKPDEGTVTVRAWTEGSQVIVDVEDDGRGVDLERVKAKAVSSGILAADEAARLTQAEALELLFHPGFSTAAQVTAISGRGVGMDVVRTNVQRIGGSVELATRAGRGTRVRMRLPLTLVVVPALVVSVARERYAIAQASVVELLRVTPERRAALLPELNGTTLLRLRGMLLPVVDLAGALRAGAVAPGPDGALSVVVLSAAGRHFGLLVDEVGDMEEIVVKPLARRLEELGVFSGATVRGDGRVALVLDTAGLARHAGVSAEAERKGERHDAEDADAPRAQFLLLRGRDDGRLAIPLDEVSRVEEIPVGRVERVGGAEAAQHRGGILPLVRLSDALPERRRHPRGPAPEPGDTLHVLIRRWNGRELGLVVDEVLDVTDEGTALDRGHARPGVAGCALMQGRITEVLDVEALLARHAAAAPGESVAAPEEEVAVG